MIDVKTGHLLIDNEQIITPQTSLPTIKKWQLGLSQNVREMGDCWSWLDVKNLKIDQLYFNISFLFNGEKIDGFTFTFQEKPYDMKPSWASWNKEAEEINLVRFNKWLNEQLGEIRAFEWGSVEALYDPRSGGSSVQLTYI